MADPTSHPNKTKVSYLTKSQVKAVRDKYTGSTTSIVIKYLASLGTIPASPLVGGAWTTINVAGDLYSLKNFSTWDKILMDFYENAPNMKYAKIVGVLKWHPGKRCYYPSRNNLTYSFVNVK